MVFRRLGTCAEHAQARRVLGAGGYRSPRLSTGEVWSGLWNLTADDGADLAAVAATERLSPRVVEVRAIAASDQRRYASRMRLLRELADACRAYGAEWLVAGAADTDAPGLDLLRRAGFERAPDLHLPRTDPIVWLALAV